MSLAFASDSYFVATFIRLTILWGQTLASDSYFADILLRLTQAFKGKNSDAQSSPLSIVRRNISTPENCQTHNIHPKVDVRRIMFT